jgi:hypothetical protein
MRLFTLENSECRYGFIITVVVAAVSPPAPVAEEPPPPEEDFPPPLPLSVDEASQKAESESGLAQFPDDDGKVDEAVAPVAVCDDWSTDGSEICG